MMLWTANLSAVAVIGIAAAMLLAQPSAIESVAAGEARAQLAAGELVRLDGGDLVIRDTLVLRRSAGGGIVGRLRGRVVGGTWLGTPGTRIVWAGPADGVVVHIEKSVDALVSDLAIDGGGKAAIGVLISSGPGHGTGNLVLRDVSISGCRVAVQAGVNAADINCADVVYDRVKFWDCVVGLRTVTDQSVNHHFRSLTAREVGTVFDFVRGGNLDVSGGDVGTFDCYLRVWRGGANAAKFRSTSVRFELDGWSKRHAAHLADVRLTRDYDVADVSFVDCQEGTGPHRATRVDNADDPLFLVGRGATVTTVRHMHGDRKVKAIVTGGSYRDEQGRWIYTAPSAAVNWQRSGEGRIRVIDPTDVFGRSVAGVNRK